MKPQNKSPETMAVAQGAEDTTQSPYSNASLAVAEFVASPVFTRTEEAKAKLGYREGLAQSVPKFRNQEHKTYENGRVARRKLARMLAKKLRKLNRGAKP
jgi:hypothetical protein